MFYLTNVMKSYSEAENEEIPSPFHDARNFNTVFTTADHWTESGASWIKSISSGHIFLKPMLFLSHLSLSHVSGLIF
jgi:hypothetical protein